MKRQLVFVVLGLISITGAGLMIQGCGDKGEDAPANQGETYHDDIPVPGIGDSFKEALDVSALPELADDTGCAGGVCSVPAGLQRSAKPDHLQSGRGSDRASNRKLELCGYIWRDRSRYEVWWLDNSRAFTNYTHHHTVVFTKNSAPSEKSGSGDRPGKGQNESGGRDRTGNPSQ